MSRMRRSVVLSMASLLLAASAHSQKAKSVPVEGARLAYIEAGSGRPVLFIHGSLGDYRNWSHQMAPFAEHYRVIALSRRYHWPNQWTADGAAYTFNQQLDDLAQAIKNLHRGPVHLVGHSYGANLALVLALTHPELVRDIVLAEPVVSSLVPPGPQADSLQRAARVVIGGVMTQFAQGDTAAALQTFMRWAIGPLDIPKADPDGWRRLLQNAGSLALQLNTPPAKGSAEVLTCDEVRKLTVPVLLVEGSNSPGEMHVAAEALAPCIPGVQRIVISKASHPMFIDNPAEFNRKVLEFLQRKPPRD